MFHSPVTTRSEAQNCSYLAKLNMLNCLQTRSRMPYRFLHIRGNWFTTSSKQHYLLPLFPKETHLTQARSIFYSNSTAFIPEARRIYYSHQSKSLNYLAKKEQGVFNTHPCQYKLAEVTQNQQQGVFTTHTGQYKLAELVYEQKQGVFTIHTRQKRFAELFHKQNKEVTLVKRKSLN